MQKRSFLPFVAEKHLEMLPKKFPIVFLETNLRDSVVSLHSHDCLEMGICLEGSGVFMFRDAMMSFSVGDITVFPAGTYHQANCDRKIASRWVFIFFNPPELLATSCDNLDLLSTSYMRDKDFPFLFRAKDYPNISHLMGKLVSANREKKEYCEIEIKAILLQILIEIRRSSNYKRDNKAQNLLQNYDNINRIAPALNYIAANYKKPVNIMSLANMCCVSVETLRRLFKRTLGKSPETYIQQIRIHIAASLLENTREPIYQIALRSGFQTISCFNRQFRKIMNLSPRNWRQKRKA